jgi:hypothetical protein
MKKKKRIYVIPFLILGMLCVLINSCSVSDDPDPITVSDEVFYQQLGYTIVKCYTDIHNQNLAGKPTGTQNITCSGPMGGTVNITGSNSYDSVHGIKTTDLTFVLTNVAVNYSATSESGNTTCTTQVTLTGSATYKGSFSATYTSLTHQSQNLHVVGSVTYAGVVRTIDMTGQVIINHSSTTSVNLFGNIVSW